MGPPPVGEKLKYGNYILRKGRKKLFISHYIWITIIRKENLNFDPFHGTEKKERRWKRIKAIHSHLGAAVVVELKLCALFYCIKIEISCNHNRNPIRFSFSPSPFSRYFMENFLRLLTVKKTEVLPPPLACIKNFKKYFVRRTKET